MSQEISWNLSKIEEICNDEGKLLGFLQSKGLISKTMKCSNCGWEMKMVLKEKNWRCYKTIKTKKGKKICGKSITINKGTWFDKTKLTYKQVLKITYMLVNNYQQKLISRELNINKSTVSQWNVFIKQIMKTWCDFNLQPIGGQGKIVEVDESKFGKRKYHKGRVLEGQWVFGGICRVTKKIFLVPVEDRTSTTLINIIKQWVLPGSTIISDCWRAYKMLNQEGYEHLTVNHSITFIDRDTGAHTNTIECMWRHIKQFLPPYNSKKEKFQEYLSHFLFHHSAKVSNEDIFNLILEELSQIKFSNTVNLEEGSGCESEKEEEEEHE